MASQPEEVFVRPSTSHEAEIRQKWGDLMEELQLQEIFLESLLDTPEDTPEQRAEFLTAIKSIKGELKKLHKQRDPERQTLASMDDSPGFGQSSSSRSNENKSSSNNINNHNRSSRNQPSSAMSGLKRPGIVGALQMTPTARNTIDETGSNTLASRVYPQLGDQSRGATDSTNGNSEGRIRDRKRSFASHLGVKDLSLPDNKSRRTTPNPHGSFSNTAIDGLSGYSDSSSTIDLSGDESGEATWKIQYREEEERLRRRKEQEEDDAYWARQLQTVEDERGFPDQQPAHPGFSAFDRVRNLTSQTSPASEGQPFTGFSNIAGAFPSSVDTGSFSTGIPSHIKAVPLSFTAGTGLSLTSQPPGWISPPPGFEGLSLKKGAWDTETFGPEPTAKELLENMELFGFGSDANTTSPSAVFGNDASRSGNSLRDIINRTSKYNLATGRDHLGNPLPAATTNFLQGLDSMESSHGVGSTAKTELKNLLANIPATTGADNQAGTPEGFLYPLYPHQKIALKWMQTMEADENKKGGILADDMGLGKTISTLALILTRPAPLPLGCRYPNPTLIVAPVSLIKQWEREAMTKIKEGRHSLAVLNAHDSSNKNMTYTDFKKFDIVLTTYDKLSREAKAFDEYVKKQAGKNEPVDDDFILKHFSFMGTRSMFHRIVLDEAQAIKSSKSLRFKAVRRLQATYRWVLTGTPMMNSVGELASLISFLRIKPYNDLSHFEHTFGILNPRASGRGGRGDVAMKKMQALLKAIMLRRTKKSKIDGKPIIQLKPKKELTKHVVFGQDEEDYYRSLEKDAQVKMSKFLREGSVGKHYQVALVLLLRLRQACCHPFLHITDLEFVNNDTPIQDMLAYAGNLKADAVQRIVTRITDKELFECPICYEPTENPSILLCGHNTCTDCLTQLRQTAEAANIQAGNEALGAKSTCPECREEIDFSAYVTCDVFKRVHMKEQWDTEQASNTKAEALVDEDGTESGVSDDEETSSDDGGDVDNRGNLIDFIVNDDDDDDDFSIVTKKAKHKRSKGESKKKDEPVQPHELAKLRKVAGRNVVARRRYFNYLERIWLDSAKITMCTELIADIQASGEKILIFSQWTMLLDLIEVQVTSKLKIGYRRYDGAMNSKQRDSAVTDFTNDDDVKLMLVSLKAGNAGLNLTVASHVVIMDPFWNPFIETQAVDRAHRIGQTKEVKVHRILIKDTVEDRIIALQEEKREVVNAALDENAAREVGRLSVNDLAFLFGIGNR